MLRRLCVYCPVPHVMPPRPGDDELENGTFEGMCWKAFGAELVKLETDPAYGLEESESCVDGIHGQLSLL